jgi:hypothetical protein
LTNPSSDKILACINLQQFNKLLSKFLLFVTRRRATIGISRNDFQNFRRWVPTYIAGSRAEIKGRGGTTNSAIRTTIDSGLQAAITPCIGRK